MQTKFRLQMKFILVLMKIKFSIRTKIQDYHHKSLIPKAKCTRNIRVSKLFDLTCIQKLWITEQSRSNLIARSTLIFSQGKSTDPSLIHFADLGCRQVAV